MALMREVIPPLAPIPPSGNRTPMSGLPVKDPVGPVRRNLRMTTTAAMIANAKLTATTLAVSISPPETINNKTIKSYELRIKNTPIKN
jgi:hypothetical protein